MTKGVPAGVRNQLTGSVRPAIDDHRLSPGICLFNG